VESAVERIQKLPPHAVDETRALRVATAREFYAHPEHVDWRRLGLLEIFEGDTYRNLARRPVASVWVSTSNRFPSASVNPLRSTRSPLPSLPGSILLVWAAPVPVAPAGQSHESYTRPRISAR